MELLLILLICAGALFYLVRHLNRHFEKRSSSCCQGCQNCPSNNGLCEKIEDKDIKNINEGIEEE